MYVSLWGEFLEAFPVSNNYFPFSFRPILMALWGLELSPYITFLAVLAARLYGWKCQSVVWTASWIYAKISPWLLHGFPQNIAQTFMVLTGWILMIVVIPRLFLLPTSRLTFLVFHWKVMNCERISHNDFGDPLTLPNHDLVKCIGWISSKSGVHINVPFEM